MKPTAQQRKRCAEVSVVVDGFKWAAHENGVVVFIKSSQDLPNAMQFSWWDPAGDEFQYKALVRKVAELLREKAANPTCSEDCVETDIKRIRLVNALATSDTDALELLLIELLENGNE